MTTATAELRSLTVKELADRADALESELGLTRVLLREARKQQESRQRMARAAAALARGEVQVEGG